MQGIRRSRMRHRRLYAHKYFRSPPVCVRWSPGSFNFWNLEQPSAEKAGINQTYQKPIQKAVTSQLHTHKISCFCPCGFPPAYTCQDRVRSLEVPSRHQWQHIPSSRACRQSARRIGHHRARKSRKNKLDFSAYGVGVPKRKKLQTRALL
jgi:hypothetical protein